MRVTTVISCLSLALVSSTAQSADNLNQLEPFNRVSACSWYEPGYLRLPGLNTCLRLGGHLRGDVITSNFVGDQEHTVTDYQAYIQSRLSFETKTPLESLTVSTYSGIEYEWSPDNSAADLIADKAYIELSGDRFALMGGINKSLYTGYEGYSWVDMGGNLWSERIPLQAAFKLNFGEFTFALGLEDMNTSDWDYSPRYFSSADFAYIAAAGFDTELFSIKASGTVLDLGDIVLLDPTLPDDASIKTYDYGEQLQYGYALNLNTELRPLDFLKFGAGVQYGVGAPQFTGFNPQTYQLAHNIATSDGANEMFQTMIARDYAFTHNLLNYMGVETLSFMGGFSVHVTEGVYFNFDSVYQSWGAEQGSFAFQGSGLAITSSLIWKPISELGIAFSAGYSALQSEGNLQKNGTSKLLFDEVDSLKIGTRIQYSFQPSF